MKPEPLKNKKKVYMRDYIESEISQELTINEDVFKSKDIKSAVEWFMNCFLHKDRVGNKVIYTKKDIEHFKDKAFEDVTKEVDVSPPEEQSYKEQLEDLGEEALKEDIEAKADLKRKEFKDDGSGYYDDKL